jgi:hypothetical protein
MRLFAEAASEADFPVLPVRFCDELNRKEARTLKCNVCLCQEEEEDGEDEDERQVQLKTNSSTSLFKLSVRFAFHSFLLLCSSRLHREQDERRPKSTFDLFERGSDGQFWSGPIERRQHKPEVQSETNKSKVEQKAKGKSTCRTDRKKEKRVS